MEVAGSRAEEAGLEVADSRDELVASGMAAGDDNNIDQYKYLRYKIKLSEYI